MRTVLFADQAPDEDIVLIVREHWFFLISRIAVWFVFVAILFAFDKYMPVWLPRLFEDPFINYINLFKNIYMMFLILGLFMVWTLYYLNIQVVTNKRILDIDQASVFSQKISELTLPNIEDVSSEITGFLGTVLSYGRVEVQTAGEKVNFVFENVPDPHEIEKLIFSLLDKSSQTKGGNE